MQAQPLKNVRNCLNEELSSSWRCRHRRNLKMRSANDFVNMVVCVQALCTLCLFELCMLLHAYDFFIGTRRAFSV